MKTILLYLLSFVIPPAGIILFFIMITKDKRTALVCLISAAASVAGAFILMTLSGLM